MKCKVHKDLGFVYYTSDGTIFAKQKDAEKHQGQINYVKESREIIERRLLVNAEKILAILNENGWGIYYKANPINLLGVQGTEPPIFSVNAVDKDILLKALTAKDEGEDKWHSETGSSQ